MRSPFDRSDRSDPFGRIVSRPAIASFTLRTIGAKPVSHHGLEIMLIPN